MTRSRILALVLILSLGGAARAAELVGVPGSRTQYTSTMDWVAAGKPVRLVLTGTALRQKAIFNVYSIGSYVLEGSAVRSPEELAAADCPKQLHLVMERTVEGKDMAEAFRAAIRMNYPGPAFGDEVGMLFEKLQGETAVKGDHIYITHLPGVGLQVKMGGRVEFVIRNPEFSRAIWDIYLGQNNLGENIKRGLVSRR
jgi:hypothetical protein